MPTSSWPGALAPVPDLPRWVEARSLVLGGRGRIVAQEPERRAWIALASDSSVGVIVGRPSAGAFAGAVAKGRTSTEWLWPESDSTSGQQESLALPGLRAHVELRMTLPIDRFRRVCTDERADVRWLMSAATTDLSMTEPEERRVLAEALETAPVAASFEHGVPVSFCWAAHETDAWWRVSVLTVRSARRSGHARAAMATLTEHYRGQAKAPVWVMHDDAAASHACARALGFVTADVVRVFARA